MGEDYIWCSSKIDLRTTIIQHIFMRLIFRTWKLLLPKLCRWHLSPYCCKQYSRSTRETNKYHVEALCLVCKQSNEGKPWQMSPFAKDTRVCKYPNIKNNNKLFKIAKIICHTVWKNLKFDKHIENICQSWIRN